MSRQGNTVTNLIGQILGRWQRYFHAGALEKQNEYTLALLYSIPKPKSTQYADYYEIWREISNSNSNRGWGLWRSWPLSHPMLGSKSFLRDCPGGACADL